MTIEFQCQRCGRTLLAPDKSIRQLSLCPDCKAMAPCRVPRYDAKVHERDTGVDVPFNVEAANPYPVSGGSPADDSAGRRRPCPICGEMIMDTAVKCRFCDEMLGPRPKGVPGLLILGVKSGRVADLKIVAINQRYVILCLFLQIMVFASFVMISLIFAPPAESGMAKTMAWTVLVLISISTIASAICAFLLMLKVDITLFAFLVLAGALIPCLNWVMLFLVAGHAGNILRKNGYSVGFLGANLSEF